MRRTDPKLPVNAVTVAVPAGSASLPAVVKVLGACLLVGLGAQVRIPLPVTDVPLTLQSLAVLLTGFALRPPQAAGAMFLYLLAGAAGLPFFASGSAGVLGPTGGYIVGFIPAAWLVSVLRGGTGASYVRLLLAGAVGTAIIYAVGVVWPARLAFYGGDLTAAMMTGIVPFAAKAVVQLFLAVTAISALRSLRNNGKWKTAR